MVYILSLFGVKCKTYFVFFVYKNSFVILLTIWLIVCIIFYEQVRAECGCHQFSMKGGGIMIEYIVKFLFLSIYANIMLLIISFALIIYIVIKFK